MRPEKIFSDLYFKVMSGLIVLSSRFDDKNVKMATGPILGRLPIVVDKILNQIHQFKNRCR